MVEWIKDRLSDDWELFQGDARVAILSHRTGAWVIYGFAGFEGEFPALVFGFAPISDAPRMLKTAGERIKAAIKEKADRLRELWVGLRDAHHRVKEG